MSKLLKEALEKLFNAIIIVNNQPQSNTKQVLPSKADLPSNNTNSAAVDEQKSTILNAITKTTLKPYVLPNSTNNGNNNTHSKETVITQKEQEPDNSAAISAAIAAAVSQLLKEKQDLLSTDKTQVDNKTSSKATVISSKESEPDNSAEVATAIAAAVSHLLKQKPELLSTPLYTNDKVISEQTPDNDNTAAAAIAAAIASANNDIASQTPETTSNLPDKITNNMKPTSNDAAAAVAISAATNTEENSNVESQSESAAIAVSTPIAAAIASQQQETINIPTNVDKRKVKPASNSTNVTATETATPPIAAAVASTQQNIIPSNSEPESNPNITAALAAAIGAENTQPIKLSDIEIKTDNTNTEQNNSSVVAAAIAANLTQNTISTEDKAKENIFNLIEKGEEYITQFVNFANNESKSKTKKKIIERLHRFKGLFSTIDLSSIIPSGLKQMPSLNPIPSLKNLSKKIRDAITAANKIQIDDKMSQVLKNTMDEMVRMQSQIEQLQSEIMSLQSQQNQPKNAQPTQPAQPNNAQPAQPTQPTKATEDTVIIYNNIVYKKDPTDPSQIIETFHKKNEQGLLEPHTRIIKLEDGTTTISVKKDKLEWKPLDLSEYDTLDANITKEGILKALKTFAAPSKTQSGGSKSSHIEAEKEEDQDDDASPPQIIKDDYTTTLIYKNLVYTSNEKWIQENYFFDDREYDSAPKNRKLRLTDSNKLELEDGNVFDIAYYDKRDNLTESKIIDMLSKMGQGQSLRKTPDA